MDLSPDILVIKTDALTRSIPAAERRRLRRPTASGAPTRLLATVGTYAATAVVLVVVCVYLVGADLELLPIVGALLVAFVVYAVVVGLKRRRRSVDEGFRLDLLAAENGLEIERDVVEPDTPGALFREGTGRLTVVRLRRRSPGFVEVGRYRATASVLDGGGAVDMGYLLVHDPDSARRWAAARVPVATANGAPVAPAPPHGGLRALSSLPTLAVDGVPHPLHVEGEGEFVLVYSPHPFRLELAATWLALAEVVRRVCG
jgi:hypothetical protein